MIKHWIVKFGLAGVGAFASLASGQVCQFNSASLLGPYGFISSQFAAVPINPPGTTGVTTTSRFSNTSLGNFLNGVNSGTQFSSGGVLFFDGSGDITATSASTGATAQAGTYVITPDCSVTITLTDPFNPASFSASLPTSFVGVILGNGNEIDFTSFITSNNGASTVNVITGTGLSAKLVRVQNRSFCSVANLQGLYGFMLNTTALATSTANASGTPVSLNPANIAGYVVFDGAGTIRANPVNAPAGTTPTAMNATLLQLSVQFSGTYLVNADCSGSMTISNAASLASASSGSGSGGATITPQSFTINFVELGGGSLTVNPFSQALPELALTVSNANIIGSGYAIAQ
jgi:hypothetical protein